MSFSQTRARSLSRRTAASTAAASASRMCTSPASVAWPDATRASRTESSRRVSRSRARFSDDLVAAREASCATVGRGRGGEVGSFPEQPGQPLVGPAPELVGERTVPPARDGSREPRGGRGGHRSHASGRPQRRVRSGPMSDQVELQHGAATDVGLVREVNEDSFLADPPVFVVADGMGGHDGGDIASQDRGGGVRPARRRRLRPAPRRRGRDRDAVGVPAPPRSSTATPTAAATADAGRAGRRRSSRCWSRTTARAGCWPTSATRASTRSAAEDLAARQRRPQPGAGAGRRRRDHRGGGGVPSRAPHRDPRPRGPRRRRPRLLRAAARSTPSACCSAPTASPG